MANISIPNERAARELLSALGEQLALRGERFSIVVVGGSALMMLGLVDRPTKDVDIVALRTADGFELADPLPEPLTEAGRVVARDFGLPEDWLNAGPASLLDFGLPDGFMDRAERRVFGESLEVFLASRVDQIHFKLYATVDQGGGKHFADLRALEPNPEELIDAARWTRTHDPSEGYLTVLNEVLAYFEVPDGSVEP